jgi:hypothetical protein
MPLINTSVPNLIQGVSQQPNSARFAGQCEEQENALSSVAEGLKKRPNTRHVARLFRRLYPRTALFTLSIEATMRSMLLFTTDTASKLGIHLQVFKLASTGLLLDTPPRLIITYLLYLHVAP